jgi:lipid-A-disaccharide synthase-like uncharacterized protein
LHDFLAKVWQQTQQPVELLGLFGQFVFFLRFVVQWIESEKRKESVIPEAFWWISIAGGAITLVYGCIHVNKAGEHEPLPPIILAQACANVIYVRNLVLVRRMKARTRDGTTPA